VQENRDSLVIGSNVTEVSVCIAMSIRSNATLLPSDICSGEARSPLSPELRVRIE